MSFVSKLIKQRVNPKTFLDNLSPESIYSEDNFNAVKYAAFYYIDSLDDEGAMLYANKLEQVIAALKPQGQNQQEIADTLVFWFLRLKLFCFRILPSHEQNELFKKYVTVVFKHNLDLRQAIFKYIDIFGTGSVIESLTGGFLSSLTNSDGMLGKNRDSFDTNGFRPTVANWLKEYQAVLNTMGGGMKLMPGAFHIVKFMDTNQYIKFLVEDEKEILKNVLDLYNWLLSPVVYSDDKQTEDISAAFVNRQKFKVPQELVSEVKSLEKQQEPTVSIPPAIKLPLPIKLPPIKRSWELGIKKQELGVKSQESRIKSQELGIKSEEEGKQISKTGQALNVPLPPTPKVVNQAEAKPAGKAAEEVDLGKVELSKVIDARLEKLKQRKRGK